jgi:hypothetical protein
MLTTTAAGPRAGTTADGTGPRSATGTTSRAARADSADRGRSGGRTRTRASTAAEQERCLAAAAAGVGRHGCEDLAPGRAAAGVAGTESASGPMAWSGRHVLELAVAGGAAAIAGLCALLLRRLRRLRPA